MKKYVICWYDLLVLKTICTFFYFWNGFVPLELTSPRTEAFRARRSCARPLENFIQTFLHRAQPKIRDPERGSKPVLNVVALLWTSSVGILVRWMRRRSSTVAMQSLRLTCFSDAVITKYRKHLFISDSYWPRHLAVDHDRAHYCLVDSPPVIFTRGCLHLQCHVQGGMGKR